MSGIYIPGMKIPGSCSDCLNIGWHYVFECHLDDAEEGKRLASCPLFSVPEHGGLIDADEFLNRSFGTGLFDEDYMRLLEELVGGSITIIPSDKEGEG